MRRWAIGCGLLIGVWILIGAGVLGWFLRTPDIQIPPREYSHKSVSRNRVDDGGAATYLGIPADTGDLSPVAVPAPTNLRRVKPEERPLIAPIWMR